MKLLPYWQCPYTPAAEASVDRHPWRPPPPPSGRRGGAGGEARCCFKAWGRPWRGFWNSAGQSPACPRVPQLTCWPEAGRPGRPRGERCGPASPHTRRRKAHGCQADLRRGGTSDRRALGLARATAPRPHPYYTAVVRFAHSRARTNA